MRDLQWTSDRPNHSAPAEEGPHYYWAKPAVPGPTPVLIRVERVGNSMYVVGQYGGRDINDRYYEDWLWSDGPIPLPSDEGKEKEL